MTRSHFAPNASIQSPVAKAGQRQRRLLPLLVLAEMWLERRQQRRALLELSDHMLKDIGLSRTDALREGVKPFWRI